jgi:hypothetical protein
VADNPRLKLDELAVWLEQQSGSSLAIEEVRDIVIDLLTGGNYRSSTETYTKEQILIHAAWLLHLAYQFKQDYGQDWQRKLFEAAFAFPLSSKAGDLIHWLLGLGKKTRQNLGLTKQQLPGYLDTVLAQCRSLAAEPQEDWPVIDVDLLIGEQSIRFDYHEVLWLLAATGAVTLSGRGSAKSYWGNRRIWIDW